MRFVIALLCFIASSSAFADNKVDPLSFSKPDRCQAYAYNAVAGGVHAFLGHPRVIIPISEKALGSVLAHLQEFPGIPVLEEDYAAMQDFITESLLDGYDFVVAALAKGAHEGPDFPKSKEEAAQYFMARCMAQQDL